MGHLGFSYIGLIFLLMLFVPNIIWARNPPKGYNSQNENKILLAFERAGQVLVTTTALIFSDFNIHGSLAWNILLAVAIIIMLLHEIWWIRYFKSEKTLKDFYGNFCGIPVPGATLPIAAFLFWEYTEKLYGL